MAATALAARTRQAVWSVWAMQGRGFGSEQGDNVRSSAGAIRDAGGAFGKREQAEEERYFRARAKEQLATLKKHHENEISHHAKEIERLQKEIERHKQSIKKLKQRSPYYDNVRPLSYPDSDAVLICFDISRPETLDSVLKKWKGEIQEFCPNTKMLLVGCKSDLRTDVSTLVELSNHRQTPVSYDQGANMAKQIGAATYIECSALQSENSVRDIFHVATLACVNKTNKNVKRNKSQRATKRISHMPSRPELSAVATDLRKDKAKSCTVM